MRSGEAIPEHDLRHAKAVDHGDSRPIAAFAAFGERRSGNIERKFRAERLVRHQRVIGPRRRGKREQRSKYWNDPPDSHGLTPSTRAV
jgi:hypothetical protein